MKLRPATEEEKRARDRLAHGAWGLGLDAKQFVVREERLRAHRWSRAAMVTWLLEDEGRVLASCETFRMDSWLETSEGRVRGATYGIASVFTEPALRGRGYASRMMQLLGDKLPGAHASILFSEVGAALYERAGYVRRPASGLLLRAQSGDPASGVDALLHEPIAIEPPADTFMVWPSADQLDWHLERERIYAELLGRPRPPACGARRGASAILWSGLLQKDTLAVLLLDARSPEDAEALLLSARRAAARAGLSRVTLWDPPGWLTGEPLDRSDTLPMIRPLTPGVTAEAWKTIPRGLWI